MRSRNEMMPPADAGPVERPVRPGSAAPHYTVRNCIWNGMAWTVSLTVPTMQELRARLYTSAEVDAMVASERATQADALHVAYSQGVADGRDAERERCAKLVEDLRWPAWVENTADAREAMAEAIRGDAP